MSTSFRRRLREELELWRADGLVSPEQAEALLQRYRLDDLARERAGALMLAVYIIGAFLIGGGVISFVAAHWEMVPRVWKIIMIVSLMLGVQIVGYYLWKISAARPKLGHTLILAGTLILGSNIGLIAQIFHIHSNWYNGVGAWAIGATAMAYALWSVPIALPAIALSFIWFCGAVEYRNYAALYPLLVAAVFLPLAYRKQSSLTFLATMLAVGISLAVAAVSSSSYDDSARWWALAMIVFASLSYSWGLLCGGTAFECFRSPAVFLGYLAACILAYVVSFEHMANEVVRGGWDSSGLFPWRLSLIVAASGSVVLWMLYTVLRKARTASPFTPAVVAALLAVLVSIIVGHGLLVNIAANVAIVVLAAGLIWSGFTSVQRLDFWVGILLTAIVVVIRFFEYETGLLLKSAVFVGCGIALIVSGTWFEGYLRKRRLCNEE